MEEFIYYKALQSYNSSDKYMLNIQKDDVLKTESPFSKSNVHPRGWLHAYNERTKEQGYVPGNTSCTKEIIYYFFKLINM